MIMAFLGMEALCAIAPLASRRAGFTRRVETPHFTLTAPSTRATRLFESESQNHPWINAMRVWSWPKAWMLAGALWGAACQSVILDLDGEVRAALDSAGVAPIEVPAQDPARVRLGEKLFFDKILSGNRDLSCSGCHHPTLSAGDGLPFSIGTNGEGLGPTRRALVPNAHRTPRNSVEIFNRGVPGWSSMFWDSRVAQVGDSFLTPAGDALPASVESPLAAQALFPILSREEQRGQAGDTAPDGTPNELAELPDDDPRAIWSAILARLLAIPRYVELFQAAYPGLALDSLDMGHAANAIAAFEVEAFSLLDSPFDRYLRGDDQALSLSQKRGALLFFGEARCSSCHSGSLLSDQQHHNIAAPQAIPENGALDEGRAKVTGADEDRFAFRTPPLRNVTVTGPYFHNGAYSTLEAAVRHHLNPAAALENYNPAQLGPELAESARNDAETRAALLSGIDPLLAAPIVLSEGEIADLLDFLRGLEDPVAKLQFTIIPETVPSGLSTGY
jgi:cytochrome c peroxidase